MKHWLILSAVALLCLIGGAQSQQPPVTVIGAVTPGHCTSFASTLQLQDAGAACGGTGVTSVFGRMGAVTAQPNDYTLTQIAPGTIAATGGTIGSTAITGGTISNTAITGGNIDNTIIGGTTPAAGSFTTATLATPLAVTSGGTGDSGTAWSTYTPSPSCGTATFTVNSARFKTMGKTTWLQGDVVIATLGTCATAVTITLPAASASSFAFSWMGGSVVGACDGVVGTTATCVKASVAVFAAGDRLIFSGVYERQ